MREQIEDRFICPTNVHGRRTLVISMQATQKRYSKELEGKGKADSNYMFAEIALTVQNRMSSLFRLNRSSKGFGPDGYLIKIKCRVKLYFIHDT